MQPSPPGAQAARIAGRDALSLALLGARNRTLAWLNLFDAAPAPPPGGPGPGPFDDPPWWVVGRLGWWQDWWIGRHLQRHRGAGAGTSATRLPARHDDADRLYGPAGLAPAQRWREPAPAPDALRDGLLMTLDDTLTALEVATDDDAGLHWPRAALWHEALAAERLAALAQRLGVAVPLALWTPPPAWQAREPLALARHTVALGAPPAPGFVPDEEGGHETLTLPDTEIDAQPVTWAQFAEFIDDGGYDTPRWWSDAGRAWRTGNARRGPRVWAAAESRSSGGPVVWRNGRAQRVPGGEPAAPLTRHEAEAWCAWAGRRLPTEAEWVAARHRADGRGFAWGTVREWTASPARLFDGARPSAAWSPPPAGAGVLRGLASATPPEARHPDARVFAAPHDDSGFHGFRSAAI